MEFFRDLPTTVRVDQMYESSAHAISRCKLRKSWLWHSVSLSNVISLSEFVRNTNKRSKQNQNKWEAFLFAQLIALLFSLFRSEPFFQYGQQNTAENCNDDKLEGGLLIHNLFFRLEHTQHQSSLTTEKIVWKQTKKGPKYENRNGNLKMW